MMKTKNRFMIVTALVTSLLAALFPAAAQDDICSQYGLNPDSAWGAFADDLDSAGIPADLWAQLNTTGVTSLEDFGITPDELNAFLNTNGEKIRDLQEANPLKPYLEQALAIMQGYGLGEGDIQPLLAVRNDISALFSALKARGLDADQAQNFLSEVAPLVQEANSRGLLKYASVAAADDALDAIDPTLDVDDLRANLGDLDAFTESLINDGNDEGDVRAGMAYILALLEDGSLNESLINGYQVKSSMYQLEKYGVPGSAARHIIGSEDGADCLSAMGLDDLTAGLLLDELGDLSSDDLDAYYAGELADFLYYSELTADELAEISDMNPDEKLAYFTELYGDESYASFLLMMFMDSDIAFLSADELAAYYDDADVLTGEMGEDYASEYADDYNVAAFYEALANADDEMFSRLFDDEVSFEDWWAENFGTDDASSDDGAADDGAADDGAADDGAADDGAADDGAGDDGSADDGAADDSSGDDSSGSSGP